MSENLFATIGLAVVSMQNQNISTMKCISGIFLQL